MMSAKHQRSNKLTAVLLLLVGVLATTPYAMGAPAPVTRKTLQAEDFQSVLRHLQAPAAEERRLAALELGERKDKQAVEPLLAALEDAESRVRCGAAWALGRIGDPRAVAPLCGVLARDVDMETRGIAAYALGQIKDPRAIPALIAALREGNETLSNRVSEPLSFMGEAAVAPLIALLREETKPEAQEVAIYALQRIADPRKLDAFLDALKSPYPKVRAAAAKVLGMGKEPRAFAPLLPMAQADPVEYVRIAAIHAIPFVDPARAVDPLLALLADPSRSVRGTVLVALGQTTDPRVLPALTRALHDENAMLRGRAVYALAPFGEKSSAALREALQDPDAQVRINAAQVLGASKRPAVAALLTPSLKDPEPQVRAAVAGALEQIGDAAAVPLLITLLPETRREVRLAAIHALGVLADESAVAPLLPLLSHAEDITRYQTAKALGKIGSPRAVEALIGRLSDPGEGFYGEGDVGQKESVAAVAARSLGQIKDPRAIEPLIAALERKDPQSYNHAVVEALQAITGKTFDEEPARWRQWLQLQGKNNAG